MIFQPIIQYFNINQEMKHILIMLENQDKLNHAK